MGRFSGVNKARQSGGGNWWKKGKYRTRITKVEFRNGHKGESYIIEGEVLASSNPEILVGETRSQVIKMDKESALGNIGSFMGVCAAVMTGENLANPDLNEVTEADVEASHGEDQPLVGLELEIDAYDIETKAGNPFTVIKYKVPAEKLGAVAA